MPHENEPSANEDESIEDSIEDFIDMLERRRKTPQVRIVDPQRMLELKAAFKTLDAIVRQADSQASVTCNVTENGLGVIGIETDALLVRDAPEFASAVKKADNFEIYPAHYGRLKMAVKFHDCLKELS